MLNYRDPFSGPDAPAPQAAQTIINDIDKHMASSGIKNPGWYVGITSDIEGRLFGFHRAPRQNHLYIYRQALNTRDARSIEAAYHKAGCQGDAGGGDHTAVYIYAYVISPLTVE
jgi:hypothetical protein